jgi:hypothetical protein
MRWPRSPSSSSRALCFLQISLRGNTTCLPFTQCSALSQTPLEGKQRPPVPTPWLHASRHGQKHLHFGSAPRSTPTTFSPLGNNHTPFLWIESLLILSVGPIHRTANCPRICNTYMPSPTPEALQPKDVGITQTPNSRQALATNASAYHLYHLRSA